MTDALSPEVQKFLADFDAFASRILSPSFTSSFRGAEWQYSPTFDQIWQSTWTEYHDLDEERKSLGIDRLDWQDGVEEWRRSEEATRAALYTGNYPKATDKFPLFYMLHIYDLELGSDAKLDRLHGWKTLQQMWDRFRQIYPVNDEFRATLSPQQKASFKLLHEWWNSDYYPRDDLDALRTRLDELAETASYDGPLKYSLAGGWISHSQYHSALLDLFIREFHPIEWEPYACRHFLKSLIAIRQSATAHAVSMRFAYATLRYQPETQGELPRLPDYPQPFRDKSGWKGNAFFQEPPAGDVSGEQYQRMLDETAAPPTYLWDVAAKQSVRVADLPSCPPYLCVSHTWGRFVHRPEQWIDIPGVRWPVKSISLYDVHDVPDMLFGLGADYVWLDLFCIPQQPCPEHHQEVANQAAIFRRATACVAWLNEIETWEVTKRALTFVGLHYLRNTCSLDEMQSTRDEYEVAYETANGHAELLKPGSAEPNPWFSSLWTLQEAALCPALHICTRQMELLKDNSGSPVSLTTLFSLLTTPKESATFFLTKLVRFEDLQYFDWPNAVRCLQRLSGTTRLGWMLTYLSPMDIMVNANYRQCKRSRAPAIMSALNIRDWYDEWAPKEDKRRAADRTALQKRKKVLEAKGMAYNEEEEKKKLPQDPLVLKTFPLEFVREAAQTIGSSFYSVLTQASTLRIESATSNLGGGLQVGSMMPFGEIHGWKSEVYAAITISSIAREDHESVRGWTIMENGSVRMASAGILASSEAAGESDEAIQSFVVIAKSANGKIERAVTEDVNLREKLKELAEEDSTYYAVTLSHDFGTLYGIILQSSRKRIPMVRRPLIKVGLFKTYRTTPMPPTSKVNWSVY